MNIIESDLRVALIARRKQLGLSQLALAVLVGRSQAQISQWEAGRRTPKPDDLIAWADALQADLKLTVSFRPILITNLEQQ